MAIRGQCVGFGLDECYNIAKVGSELCFKCQIKKLEAELATAKAENKRLKDFARPVIRQECWSLFPQDGGDLQKLAEKLGLIVPKIATAEDVDDESDVEVGDRIYKFSDILKEKP